ncbi:exported hypothetical protein [Candidatus Sulfotelmatomonas gaucii]|uniref:DUF4185 domain-containing protein n=1 Tax=Candidatus Sulfuritelmatomonas gaucii TaxID=2043161 RepID=A0A2N9M6Y6_9BACT|nr:exported hypothetical protein [Candidatus Sulfotelmatomonas gaucii]
MRFSRSHLSILLLAILLSAQGAFGQTADKAAQIISENFPPKSSDVMVSFEWVGDESAYPTPGAGDDVAPVDPASAHGVPAYGVRFGDTFPMTWADDDEIYASAGDPNWGAKWDGLDVERFSGIPPHYTITRVNAMPECRGSGGGGPKPTGMISVHGVLYLAVQNVLGKKPPAFGTRSQHGDDTTIISSRDHGKTWTPARADIKAPMFPGHIFGGPAFVNSGRDNAGAPDKYVYAVSTDQWDNGSNLRVGRVPANRIQDVGAWQWISELKSYKRPRWSSELNRATPVLTDDRRISLPEMIYIGTIKRYLLLTWRLYKDFSNSDGTELMIYAAPHPWGPFTLVHEEAMWESKDMNPYCPRIPLKWLKVNGDEIDGWMQFSGSWRKTSTEYRSHVREFRMKIARTVTITVDSAKSSR